MESLRTETLSPEVLRRRRLERRRRAARRRRRRNLTVAVLLLAICLLTGALFLRSRPESLTISGVPAQVTVFADEDILAAALDGVTAVGGEDRAGQEFPVQAVIYDGSRALAGGESCPPGTYRLVYSCEADRRTQPVESALLVRPADKTGPIITGARDLSVEAGGTVSYRDGVTAEDEVDGPVRLQVDSSQVDLSKPGTYPVVYSAADSRGNRSEAAVTLTVTEPPVEIQGSPGREPIKVDQQMLDDLADSILAKIVQEGMTTREKARAVFDYVHKQIKYVGTSDKSSWIGGAYVGLTQGRGDCYNYFAASKELLTRLGIPNIDLSRVGGNTDHYWQLVNVGDGWYHFDACPHPNEFPFQSFMLTEAEVREYTERCKSVRLNYYVYDYANCPVTVEGTPEEAGAQTDDPTISGGQ